MKLQIEPIRPKERRTIDFPNITCAMSSGELTFFGSIRDLSRLKYYIEKYGEFIKTRNLIRDFDRREKILFVASEVTHDDTLAFEF